MLADERTREIMTLDDVLLAKEIYLTYRSIIFLGQRKSNDFASCHCS
jgi:hypothetical protein